MKDKHYAIRVEQCLMTAEASDCVQHKRGALLLDPERNVVLMDGYEEADHHAEARVITSAAATGTACVGAWLFVTGAPCLACARLIYHAEIRKVIIMDEPSSNVDEAQAGVDYLVKNNVQVENVPTFLHKVLDTVRGVK